jgi:hypothetical protein
MLTRQAKRRIQRAARKHIAAIDADLIARLKAEKAGLLFMGARNRAWVSEYAG